VTSVFSGAADFALVQAHAAKRGGLTERGSWVQVLARCVAACSSRSEAAGSATERLACGDRCRAQARRGCLMH
jgi:hypothetical protein